MKIIYVTIGLAFLGLLTIASCKSKSNLDDPTILELNVLVELDEGIPAKKLIIEFPEYKIEDFKATNRTLNQYIYVVTLKGQTSNELLKALNAKSYVKSAIIAPTGDGPAENMPSGKSTRTSPIKG